jgi:hypothetical protein
MYRIRILSGLILGSWLVGDWWLDGATVQFSVGQQTESRNGFNAVAYRGL